MISLFTISGVNHISVLVRISGFSVLIKVNKSGFLTDQDFQVYLYQNYLINL